MAVSNGADPVSNGGDPAAYTRIRAAAVREFATSGDAVSVAAIADAAGVPAEAVEHHFPSRAELRDAVDEHVLGLALAAFADFEPDESADDAFEDLARRVTAVIREHPDELLYVARATIDGEPGGLGMFDAFMAIALGSFESLRAKGRLDPDLDVEWAALHVVIFNLSTLLFRHAIENHLPEPFATPEGIERWHAADTELFRRGFLRPDPSGSARH
jgi:AcrR family transcriptional regulator